MSLYTQLFVECVGKGSLVPFVSDTTFFAMKAFGSYDMKLPVVLATIGATIGQSVNWIVGNLINQWHAKGKVNLGGIWFTRLQKLFNNYFVLLLLLSWAPLCNLITVAAGMFGTRFKVVLPLLLIGQAGYYYYALTH